MRIPQPAPLPYDIKQWKKDPFPERLRKVCLAWAMQGYGTPWPIYLLYVLKVGAYLAAWCFFCSFTPGMGDPRSFLSWAFTAEAFQKAILWSMAFEGLGFGCGSGPLTGRYFPPLGGFLHFARPGTTKLPLFPGLPLLGGDRRTVLEVALYLAHYGFLFRALVAPVLTPDLFVPPLGLLFLLALSDKTIFLASRAEHYATVLVCFLFVDDWLAGSKLVWMAVWLWAATSKLNRHFPYVVTVMLSNSPFTRFPFLRKLLYRRYPEDLRPSTLTHVLAHCGTLTEYAFPLLLLFGNGGTTTQLGLLVMLSFHIFITSTVPMGVPIEWNFLMVYGAFFLFGHHATVDAFQISSPILIGYLVASCFIVQLVGNFIPSQVSFLCSMRYYAGNWAYSVWLFKENCSAKLDTHVKKSAPHVRIQLAKFFDDDTGTALLSKIMAFRAMHLHGRALQSLLPRAIDDIDRYEYLDGELVAGVVLGWNFGEGHLHDLQLLQAVQRQCNFKDGELRCIFVEAQPVGQKTLRWTIADAATGVRETGALDVRALRDLQPWPATTTSKSDSQRSKSA